MSYGKRHLVLALAAGLVLGLLGARYARRPHGPRGQSQAGRIDNASKKLELTPDQRLRLEQILQKSSVKIEASRLETRAEIRAILNEKQRVKFDAMTARRDRMRGDRR